MAPPDYLTRALVIRAAFRRTAGELVSARQDLAEATKLVERSGFRLYAADCALEEARIALTESRGQARSVADAKRSEAHAAFLKARNLIEEMGYGRRRPDLAELAHALGESDGSESRI